MNIPPILVIFRNDDLSALSDLCHERRIAELFIKFHAPLTVGVVPFHTLSDTHACCDNGFMALHESMPVVKFLEEIKHRGNAEIALHGYTHRTNRLSSPGKREYFEFKEISYIEQTDLLEKGTEEIRSALDFRPFTFIPPWNRLDENTVKACKATGFGAVSAGPYTPTLDDIVSFGTNCGLFDFPMLLESARKTSMFSLLHILFHSKTTRSEEDINALKNALKLARSEPRCRIMTIKDAAQKYPEKLREVNEAGKNVEHQSEIQGSIRARGYMYYRLIKRVHQSNNLIRLYQSAKDKYLCSEYIDCVRIGTVIEFQLKWTIIFFKILVCIVSFILAAVVFKVSDRLPIESQGVILAVWVALLVVFGASASKSATSPDTKLEIKSLTWLGILGAVFGFVMVHHLL